MSLKSIEMQIAIPRTTEATAIQNQLNQRPAQEQAAMAEQASKKMKQNRQRSTEIEETAYLNIRDDQSGARANSDDSRKQKRKRQSYASPEAPSAAAGIHPFKGKHIDISL